MTVIIYELAEFLKVMLKYLIKKKSKMTMNYKSSSISTKRQRHSTGKHVVQLYVYAEQTQSQLER